VPSIPNLSSYKYSVCWEKQPSQSACCLIILRLKKVKLYHRYKKILYHFLDRKIYYFYLCECDSLKAPYKKFNLLLLFTNVTNISKWNVKNLSLDLKSNYIYILLYTSSITQFSLVIKMDVMF